MNALRFARMTRLSPRIAPRMAAPFACYSTRIEIANLGPEPSVVANSLIDSLPGSSLAAKSSSALIGASITAWLLSKEIYLIDAEFFEMLALFGAYYIVYTGGKDGAVAYFEERKNVISLSSLL